MRSNVTRFNRKKTYGGRDVKRTLVRHARTANRGKVGRKGRGLKSYVR